jgi:hypothetical protein
MVSLFLWTWFISGFISSIYFYKKTIDGWYDVGMMDLIFLLFLVVMGYFSFSAMLIIMLQNHLEKN